MKENDREKACLLKIFFGPRAETEGEKTNNAAAAFGPNREVQTKNPNDQKQLEKIVRP